MPPTSRIAAVRRFTRFYTTRLGVLGQRLLHSPFSLTEARVLYELAHHDGVTARDLGGSLGIDAGYLSRILAGFARRGLITRRRSASDGRERRLGLTKDGRGAFAPLDRGSNAEVGAMLAAIPVSGQRSLVSAMRTVERLLTPASALASPARASAARGAAYSLRDYRPGDIGWITHRQAVLYHQEYGWNVEYEALIAGIMSKFVTTFDPAREKCWVAEIEGEIVGSVFVVQKTRSVAQLRLLYVEPDARGLGIGRRLVDECIRFARSKKYGTLTLWTNSVLTSARRIYESAGFRLVKEEKHRSFGKNLVGQNWDLRL
jgi:DNA-binding MarR family transcriptional regulator/N-acetylglutamate synthase-like GNAT family acetyltransferase